MKCKNCKHYWFYKEKDMIGTTKVTNFYCDPTKSVKKYGDSPYWNHHLTKCKYKDKEHTCSGYQRKWWKIWAPKENIISDLYEQK